MNKKNLNDDVDYRILNKEILKWEKEIEKLNNKILENKKMAMSKKYSENGYDTKGSFAHIFRINSSDSDSESDNDSYYDSDQESDDDSDQESDNNSENGNSNIFLVEKDYKHKEKYNYRDIDALSCSKAYNKGSLYPNDLDTFTVISGGYTHRVLSDKESRKKFTDTNSRDWDCKAKIIGGTIYDFYTEEKKSKLIYRKGYKDIVKSIINSLGNLTGVGNVMIIEDLSVDCDSIKHYLMENVCGCYGIQDNIYYKIHNMTINFMKFDSESG
jgi:hypothetical protein